MVGAVFEVGVMCLVRLHLCTAMSSFTVVLSLCVPGVGFVKVSSILGDGVVRIATLGYDGMSDGVCEGDIGNGFNTLGDLHSFLSSVVFVNNHWLVSWGCYVGVWSMSFD